MNKITRHQLAMSTAVLNSMRADCSRGKVGAALVMDGRVIATSYNGALPGSNGCNNDCDLSQACQKTLHAEANLISFCAKNGIKTNKAVLYLTLTPCKDCAKLIIQAGIKEVYYLEAYRNDFGEKLLRINNVIVYKYDEEAEGNIIFENRKK